MHQSLSCQPVLTGTGEKTMTKSIERAKDGEENTEFRIYRLTDGRYSVGVFDVDANQGIAMRMFSTKAEADSYFDTISR